MKELPISNRPKTKDQPSDDSVALALSDTPKASAPKTEAKEPEEELGDIDELGHIDELSESQQEAQIVLKLAAAHQIQILDKQIEATEMLLSMAQRYRQTGILYGDESLQADVIAIAERQNQLKRVQHLCLGIKAKATDPINAVPTQPKVSIRELISSNQKQLKGATK